MTARYATGENADRTAALRRDAADRKRKAERAADLLARARSITQTMAALDHERAAALVEAQILLRDVRET